MHSKASGNIYESYTMSGQMGGDPGSNYLEHCGGYSWAVTEGLFGVDFNSDNAAAATITDPSHRIDPSWPAATYTFSLRGTTAKLTISGSSGLKSLSLSGHGPAQRVRVIWDGSTKIETIGTGFPAVAR